MSLSHVHTNRVTAKIRTLYLSFERPDDLHFIVSSDSFFRFVDYHQWIVFRLSLLVVRVKILCYKQMLLNLVESLDLHLKNNN